MTDPTNPHDFDEAAYEAAEVEAEEAFADGGMARSIEAMWKAGGTPQDIIASVQSLVDRAVRELAEASR